MISLSQQRKTKHHRESGSGSIPTNSPYNEIPNSFTTGDKVNPPFKQQ